MYSEKSIAVVVPCFNESKLIVKVMDTMPDFVDEIVVVDDCSSDDTVSEVNKYCKTAKRDIKLICHEVNQGVGGAIATGYKYARDKRYDVAVVMAGDAQMDPNELGDILDPVVKDQCDYSKGNRLFSGDAWEIIPRVRYLGNSLMSLLTKVASGYWHIADSQSGYTAINLKALDAINWDSMYKRYGQPNDLLVRLNIYNFRVKDVPITPIYNVGEESGIKPIRMIPKLSSLMFRLFIYRMIQKYLIRDFHPLLFFYTMAFILFPPGFLLGAYLFVKRIFVGPVAETSALFAVFLVVMGLQSMFFAMWMDMESNRDLK